MRHRGTTLLALVGLTAGAVATGGPVSAAVPAPAKAPLAIGTGGAVATVDPDATAVGLDVLRRGGNAADAAVAAAAALGVTEPYSAGVGGGGFFLYYDAETRTVSTIDGRETAPQAMRADTFLDEQGDALPFDAVVRSGLSVGTPGTPRTWQRALDEFGTMSLRQVLRGGIRLADKGFVVDETFRQQTAENEEKFRTFAETTELFLPGGELPEVGSVFRNPDLASTYRLLARRGVDAFYTGPLARDVVAAAQDPQESPGAAEVFGGLLTDADLAGYTAPTREATRVDYRGLEVYGMAPPSSGGSTVGEALNILEQFRLSSMSDAHALHHYLEAGALAFADRNAYVGDPAYTQVPLRQLLSEEFARERSCLIDPARAAAKPVPAGVPDGTYEPCPAAAGATVAEAEEGLSTTHLTVADAEGNIASYTLTIEATGGSGITVPGRGFILNNELTDFTFKQVDLTRPEPNLPAPGKRPRSSMAPTIVLDDGEPRLAMGSPGGSTIITTVLQTLVNRVDRNMNLAEAIAAPRATPRNGARVNAEPAFLEAHGEALTALGHEFNPTPEIGAATGIEFLPGGLVLAAAEPERRGGGSAGVVHDVLGPRRDGLDLAPQLAD
ncbi:gamma-glutamyltranspeptidase/glutathione hydrolase [Kineococcus xinjiangensis]|uniref:Glutathione hydrolase proenzyme n=1 Tax=Kineococcus xinjiangensis TaxID=512762 RepID=A0A2S6IJC4_9ACTN|nr:gamma-glutamyltransferase [Kineococcus xinjiangensis]PPK94260.1 gamma-glutamyltranspeptidase/glutathione hydrolase [Kineococcus xinjiangensis]